MNVFDVEASFSLDIDDFERKLKQAEKNFKTVAGVFKNTAENIDRISNPIDRHGDAVNNLGDEYKKTGDKMSDAIDDASDEIKDSFKEIESSAKKTNKNQEELAETAKRSSRDFADNWDKAAESIEKMADRVKATISAVAKAGAAAVATASTAITAIVSQSTAAYANYEQLAGGVETLFKGSADKVKAYADAAYKTAGMSVNQYMETVTSFSASLLQGLGGDTEKAADLANQAIIDMSDNANKMGTDISMIQNAYQGFAKQNYTMLDNLKLGYGGTQAEMARLINESGVLGDTIEVTAETVNEVSFDKIIEAIHVIQTEMGLTGTTAAEAADTISGSAGSMKAAWENLMVEIAKDDGNISQKIDEFAASAEVAFDNSFKRIEKSLDGLGQLIEAASPIIAEKLPVLLETVLPEILKMGASITLSIGKAILSSLPELARQGGNIILALADGINSNSSSVINAISKGIYNISTWISKNAPALIKMGMQLLESIISGIVENLPIITDSINTIIETLGQILADNAPQLLEMGLSILLTIVQGISENASELIDSALIVIQSLSDFLTDSLPDLIPSIVGIISEIAKTLTNPSNLIPLLDSAISIIKALADGLIAALPTIINDLPIIVDFIVTALVEATPRLVTAAFEIIGKLLEYLLDPENLLDILEAGGEIVLKLGEGLTSMFEELGLVVLELIAKIGDPIGDVVEDAWDWGSDLISNFIDGIEEKFWELEDALEGVGETVFDWLHHSTPEKGPLKDDDEWGGDLVDNLINGMLERKNSLVNTVKSLAEGISTGFDSELDMSASISSFSSGLSSGTMSQNLTSNSPIIHIENITINAENPEDENFGQRVLDKIVEALEDNRIAEIVAQGGKGW